MATISFAPSGQAATFTIAFSAARGGYVPESLIVRVGDTVVWLAESPGHTVAADDRSFASRTLVAGETFTHTFTRPGIVPYYCANHGLPGGRVPGSPTGEIVVMPAGSPPFVINEGVQGSWLNNATGGQGVFFDVVPSDGLFALAWFTWKTTTSENDWLTAVGRSVGGRAELQVFRSRGGRFNAPDPVTTTPVGTASVVFTNCTTASFRFSLNDPPVDGAVTLARLLPASPLCVSANPTLAGPP